MNLWTVPNALSISRCLVSFWLISSVILVGPGFQQETLHVVLLASVYGALSDLIDGWIARTWPSQQSAFGAWIDPIADKMFVFSLIAYIVVSGDSSYFEYGCFACIVVREGIVVLLRWYGGAALMPVNRWGKYKTAVQMPALIAYMALPAVPWSGAYLLASVLLLAATVLTAISFVVYLRQGFKRLIPG